MTSLAELLCQERETSFEGRSALGSQRQLGSDRFAGANSSSTSRGLRDRLSGAPSGGWLLLTEDAYSFAVGLLALWHSGRHAISPPNKQPGALRSQQTRAAGVLSDRPDWFQEGSTLAPDLAKSGRGRFRRNSRSLRRVSGHWTPRISRSSSLRRERRETRNRCERRLVILRARSTSSVRIGMLESRIRFSLLRPPINISTGCYSASSGRFVRGTSSSRNIFFTRENSCPDSLRPREACSRACRLI